MPRCIWEGLCYNCNNLGFFFLRGCIRNFVGEKILGLKTALFNIRVKNNLSAEKSGMRTMLNYDNL